MNATPMLAALLCVAVRPLAGQDARVGPALNLAVNELSGVGITFPVAPRVWLRPQIILDRSRHDSESEQQQIRTEWSTFRIGITLHLLVDLHEGPVQWYGGFGGGVTFINTSQRYVDLTGGTAGPLPADQRDKDLSALVSGVVGGRVPVTEAVSIYGEVGPTYLFVDRPGGSFSRLSLRTSSLGIMMFF